MDHTISHSLEDDSLTIEQSLCPGDSIDGGSLRILSVLGAGSFATVYRVKSTSPPYSTFALKLLPKHSLSPSQLDAQRTEAEITSRVQNHPNIVKLVRVIDTHLHFGLLMEECKTDLFEVIAAWNGKRISDLVVRRLFAQILAAVEHCHALGVAHRDLKPENILISSGSSPDTFHLKLTDFGLATTSTRATDFSCGSVRYMAPECLLTPQTLPTSSYDPFANDVWSLGVILFNLLTLKNPWHLPSTEDPTYAEYIARGVNVFVDGFGVSWDCARLLGDAMRVGVEGRLGVAGLKNRVEQCECFWASLRDSSLVPDDDRDEEDEDREWGLVRSNVVAGSKTFWPCRVHDDVEDEGDEEGFNAVGLLALTEPPSDWEDALESEEVEEWRWESPRPLSSKVSGFHAFVPFHGGRPVAPPPTPALGVSSAAAAAEKCKASPMSPVLSPHRRVVRDAVVALRGLLVEESQIGRRSPPYTVGVTAR
ncbi:kinase-like domain-containing protein [Cladochytrium replicatum]|nr:kinase-like domain-containing protein [Cladochytrium replicatum]